MAKRSNAPIYLVALLLFMGGFGWLVFSGLSENSVYFLNVSEALAMERSELGSARLFGTVAPTRLEREDNPTGVRFLLQDYDVPSQTLYVAYRGAVPDTFKPGVEVIVEGKMQDGTDTFAATSLMTKCPSKYQKENRDK